MAIQHAYEIDKAVLGLLGQLNLKDNQNDNYIHMVFFLS